MTRSGLYFLTGAGLAAGYTWLGYQWARPSEATLCLMKGLTGVPCPSCGVTRSITHILSGDQGGAFALNPLGFVLVSLMIVLPIWLVYDLITSRQTLFNSYKRAEAFLQNKKGVRYLLVILTLLIWARNIYNGI